MWEWFFGDFSIVSIVMLMISAVLIGINKTGMPGLGLVPVLILASAFPARASTGLQLLMIGAADIMAVLYYRRHADWSIVLRLLPWALAGIAVGSFAMRFISDSWMRPLLAWIILFMVAANYIAKAMKNFDSITGHRGYAAGFGLLAGFTTQVANAAGPIMSLYLLSMRLDKNKYMGSAAWYFLILNWIKIPIFVAEGRITMTSLRADLAMIPFLIIGGLAGIFLLKKISQQVFERVVEVLVVIGALDLLIPREWWWPF